MESKLYISKLSLIPDLLDGKDVELETEYDGQPLCLINNETISDSYFIVDSKVPIYPDKPEFAYARYLYSLKTLIAISGQFMPIYDENNHLVFDREEYEMYRRKLSGIKEYGAGDYLFSDNLYFNGLDKYLAKIDENFYNINFQRNAIVAELTRILATENIVLSTELGKGDVEIIDTGSTSRGTNVPNISETTKWDFDFLVRVNPEDLERVRSIFLKKIKVLDPVNGYMKNSKYRIRLLNVIIPGLKKALDIDLSFTPQKKKYISTDAALNIRFNNMRSIDEEKYRLVIANIMYTRHMLKQAGVYKPAHSLKENSINGGLGGIGIENWIIQNGGSLIDASNEFLRCADGKDFTEFVRSYAVIDSGKNHTSVAKGNYPYDNFLMKNMQSGGYELMKSCLSQFLKEQEMDKQPKQVVLEKKAA